MSVLRPSDLTCDGLFNPLGVDDPIPLLAWVNEPNHTADERQTGCRIVAASSPAALTRDAADLWDTGWVASERSTQVPWVGSPLASRQVVHWKVKVRGRDGAEGPWSDPARFEMGLLQAGDWSARWIGADTKVRELPSEDQPAPFLRVEFDLPAAPVRARAYVCGLGWHELHLNGVRVGDDRLAPAFTRYDVRAQYLVHDITAHLGAGANAAGVVVGNGWYNHQVADVWDFKQAPWRDQPKAIVQLHVWFTDGTERVVGSGPDWRWAQGPIRFDALRNGERYDARLELDGWAGPGYDDAAWKPAKVVASPGGTLSSQQATPIRVSETFTPVAVNEVAPGIWVFDIGRDISGWARIRPRGPAGTRVGLRYAEKLKETGDIDQSNIDSMVKSGECQSDAYTLRGGDGPEVWEPRFTYHGFQYVRATGWPGTPRATDLDGRAVHTDFPSRGEFSCSNGMLNAVQECARRSTLYNYPGFPTDCPHREKNGWTGDAHLSAEQALLNFDMDTAYRKWMRDFRDVQRASGQLPCIVPTGGWGFAFGSGPAWDSAALLIPWYLYVYRGDLRILAEQYDCMRRYVEFLATMADAGIVDFGLGDWCPPEWRPSVAWQPTYRCPTAVTDTAYYHVDALILSRAAALLGKTDDARHYAKVAGNVRAAWRARFLDTATGRVAGDCQASLACAIYQGMVEPGPETARVLARLVESVEGENRHIGCGILGAKYLMHGLTREGRADLAYAVADQRDFPGWGHMIARGATTLWETWNGDSSRNHHMFGDVSAWFYEGLAGVNPDPAEPGFRHVVVKPNPVGDLRWVRARHRSPYGWIECAWGRDEEGRFVLDLAVPVGCRATVHVPGGTVREVTSGWHRFESRLPGGA
jgi:alpha-L-rhamnosidase